MRASSEFFQVRWPLHGERGRNFSQYYGYFLEYEVLGRFHENGKKKGVYLEILDLRVGVRSEIIHEICQ